MKQATIRILNSEHSWTFKPVLGKKKQKNKKHCAIMLRRRSQPIVIHHVPK